MLSGIGASDILERNDPRAMDGAGEFVRADGKTYKYVQLLGDVVTPVAGQVVYRHNTDTNHEGYLVTADIDESLAQDGSDVLGVLTYAATPKNWTYMQTWGYNGTTCTDGNGLIFANDGITGGVDGVCVKADLYAEFAEIGRAVYDEDQSADTVAVFLTIEQ